MAKQEKAQARGKLDGAAEAGVPGVTDEEKRLAVVLCRGHYRDQPDEAKLAIFDGLSARRRAAMVARLRKLSPGELKAFKAELDGTAPREAAESAGESQGGDDGTRRADDGGGSGKP